MRKDRFWFGVATIAVPVLFLVVSRSPGLELTQSGPVEGQVTFHGRPLAGGLILFVPEGMCEGTRALAWIDEEGHYRIGSVWDRKASSSKTRYRICLTPDTDKVARPSRHGDDYATAWSGAGDVAFPAPPTSSGFPAKVCDPKTTQFEVLLGSEPARVDITF
jgi:hypothetical protein